MVLKLLYFWGNVCSLRNYWMIWGLELWNSCPSKSQLNGKGKEFWWVFFLLLFNGMECTVLKIISLKISIAPSPTPSSLVHFPFPRDMGLRVCVCVAVGGRRFNCPQTPISPIFMWQSCTSNVSSDVFRFTCNLWTNLGQENYSCPQYWSKIETETSWLWSKLLNCLAILHLHPVDIQRIHTYKKNSASTICPKESRCSLWSSMTKMATVETLRSYLAGLRLILR